MMDIDQETELDSDYEDAAKESHWHDNGSNSGQTFTLNLEVCGEKEYSDISSSSDLIIATNDEGTDNCGGRRKERNRRISFVDEIPIVFQEMEDEIERQLDAKAAKTNLTVNNVKNILKSVITNEDVMEMVRHSIQTGGEEKWSTYEPKLTRAKAKELMKAQPEIALPLYTPIKKQSECHILIDKDLSEDSSDDEYKPVEEDQEQSEDEKSSMADSLSSPVRKVSTPIVPSSPDFQYVDSVLREEETVVNIECGTQTYWSEDGLFKIPHPRQESAEGEEENIGQRTRSKLCLNNTPLQVIESAFIPPDITTDMYDSDCDDEDWKSFLKDFALNNEDTENVDDDDAADPEYNVLADFDIQSVVDEEELRVDKAVKISRKEKKVLMAEAHEPLYSDDDDNFVLQQFLPALENPESLLHSMPQVTDPPMESVELQWDNPSSSVNGCYILSTPDRCSEPLPPVDSDPINVEYLEPLSPPPSPCEPDAPRITPTQLSIFKQQMRQYVQILTQNFLQTYSHPIIGHHADRCRSLLVNLKCLSLNKLHSNFEAENLNWAIELIGQWEKRLNDNPEERKEIRKKVFKAKKISYNEKLPTQLMDFMAKSKVFLYPLLLPEKGFHPPRNERFIFNRAEEQLIALGLEQFITYYLGKGEIDLRKVVNDVVGLIHQNMLPFKNYVQTKRHILKAKYKKRYNPIKYYFEHGNAPETQHYVFPIDWNNIKCPKDQPSQLLPELWSNFVYGYDKEKAKVPRGRNQPKKRDWSKKYAIPVLLLGEFPDEKAALAFGQGTIDYSLISGRVFRMLPSMPLISNVSKDIVECASLTTKLPKVILTMESINRSTQTNSAIDTLSLPSLSSPSNASNKRASPLKRVTPILKKYNSHRKGKGGKSINNIPSTAAKGSVVAVQGKPAPRSIAPRGIAPRSIAPRTIAPKRVVVIVPSEEINFQEVKSSSTEKPRGVHGLEDVTLAPEAALEKSPSTENVQPTVSVSGYSQKGNEKKDNEDELAALMLASSTIRGPGSSLEKKRRSKQQRDTDANLALLSPEKGSAMEERDSSFAQSFFKKVHERLENCKDGSSSYEAFVHNLNVLEEKRSNEADGKTNEEIENYLGRLLNILAPHRDLVEEFPVFLSSKQALHYGCLANHLSAVQMRDFLHKLEVYFAKQPSHLNKIVTILSELTKKPDITLEEIKEEVIPLLKGNAILLNKLLQLLPTERPPESLMTDFEELEFWDDVEPMGEDEPVEVVRLPERESEDRFGGEGCACSCHSSPSPDAPQTEKDACRSSHCNRCGLKFVNGRVVLQTAKGIRPARVIFDSPADFQRLVVKDSAVPPPRLGKGRSRKKSKANDIKEESTSPPPKVRILHGAESEEEVGAVKFPELSSSPRAQPRSVGKGAKTFASKGKDSKTASASHKSVAGENSHALDTTLSPKLDASSEVVSSGVCEKASSSTIGSNIPFSEHQTAASVKNVNTHLSEKNVEKLSSLSGQDEEAQQCTRNSFEEPISRNDQISCSSENGNGNAEETPWTREEDRIILQTFQVDGGKSDTLVKIRQKLPGRSVAEIASRFNKLMSLFRKMTGPSTAACESEDIDLEKR